MRQQQRCLKYILKFLRRLCKKNFQIKDQRDYFPINQRDFVIPTVKLVNYGLESIRFLGPKVWESLANNLKNKESIESFKMAVQEWKTESCKTYLQNIDYLQQENKIRQIQTRTYVFISFVIDFQNTKIYLGIEYI